MIMGVSNLLGEAQLCLGLSQGDLGSLLGASKRTGQRWAVGHAYPSAEELHVLARHVHKRDPQLADKIALASGTTLVALGLAAAPSPPSPPFVPQPDRIIDSVVCAAAEAMDVMPRAIRPALLAAFTRAQEIGLSVDTVVKVLRAGTALPKPPTPANLAAVQASGKGGREKAKGRVSGG